MDSEGLVDPNKAMDAYREGYEKGRADNIAGHVGEALLGLLRDDPGGYFATGYHDGAAGKKYNPPPPKERRQASPRSASSTASDLERAWYRLCNSSEFIPQGIVDQYVSALRAEGSHVAIAVGLSDFTGHTCPRCKRSGQFKIHFLGRLEHPGECGWSGYMGTGAYIGHQLGQVFHLGIRAGGSMKDDANRKGERGWMEGIFGFLFVAVFRAVLAVFLIPFHTVAALLQPNQSRSDTIIRVAILCVYLVAILVLFIPSLQLRANPVSSVSIHATAPAAIPPTAPPTAPVRKSVMPSFDCGKARTKVELLICRDASLVPLEVEMASTYRSILNRLPPEPQLAFRREHLAWFKEYSRTCNRIGDDERQACVARYLSNRTTEMRERWP